MRRCIESRFLALGREFCPPGTAWSGSAFSRFARRRSRWPKGAAFGPLTAT